MKYKKPFFILLLLSTALLVNSCSKHESPRYVKLADSLTDKTAKKLAKEKGLVLFCTGGGMMGNIKKMNMSFYYQQSVDMQQARDLLVYSVEEYLSAINNDPEIRPFLHNYPFTIKNIEIEIYFQKQKDSTLTDMPKVASVNHGKISYYINEPPMDDLKKIHTESYETALQVCKEEQANR